MRSLLALLVLIATPALAAAAESGGPRLGAAPTLDLTWRAAPEVEPPTARAVDEEWRLKATRNANPLLKVLPLALALPVSIAGVSVHDSAPIAYALGDVVGERVLRPTGLALMAGGMTANIVMNITSRAERAILGGQWNHHFERFAVPVSLLVAGYALTAAGGHPTVLATPGATLGLLIPGAAAWTVGTILLAVDTMQTAFELDPQIAGVRLWVAPTPDAFAMGATLRF